MFVLDSLPLLNKGTPSISNKEHPKNSFHSCELEGCLKHTQIDLFFSLLLIAAMLVKPESKSPIVTSRMWEVFAPFKKWPALLNWPHLHSFF